MKNITVRAFYRAATVSGQSAPYNTLNMKVYYPCDYGDDPKSGGDDPKRAPKRGVEPIPANTSRAPYPVVVMLPGIDLTHENYGWMAQHLAESGFAVLTYDWVAQEGKKVTQEGKKPIGISPGINRKRLKHGVYGKKPSCPALKPLFKELKNIQKDSVLAGLLDLDKIVLGGHSVGGTMALLNANPKWFPQMCGVFSYAAHALGDTAQGWKRGSVMPLSRHLPMLIMGGSRDGVIAAGSKGSPAGPIERTFRDGIKGKRGDRHVVIIKGANHFLPVWPQDSITGQTYLDQSAQGSKRKLRKYLTQLITNFCDYACNGNAMSGAELQSLANTDHPLAALAEHK